MYLWMRWREHALSHRRTRWPSLIPRSMATSPDILMVWVGGVEVTRILREVCVDEWVAAARRGAEPPFLEPYV
jgi:hypothetical protein